MKDKQLFQTLLSQALAAKERTQPRCQHFGECGGCDLQSFTYDGQVAAKREVLERLIQHFELEEIFAGVKIDAIGSPSPYHYRQRMDYVFAFGRAGLRQKNSHKKVVALNECHLIGPPGFAAFRRVRELAEQHGLEDYDYLAHTGFLRYVVVRQTRGGEVLVSLVTKREELAETIEAIAKTLLDEGLARSVHWLLQDGLADTSFGEPLRHYGEPYLEERFFGKRFLIGPNTFFQANPALAGRIYERIIARRARAALDLFSGTGVIAILLADEVESVTAVENSADNQAVAAKNRARNGAANVELVAEDVAAFLRRCRRPIDYAVANPPRAGIGGKAIRPLLALGPQTIAYLSCNPLSLLRDLALLTERYHIESACLFDMFPQTRHFETLVFLQKT